MKLAPKCFQSFVPFTQNEVDGAHLTFFQKKRFQSFMSEILRVAGLLVENVIFFNCRRTTQVSLIFKFSAFIHSGVVKTFQNNLVHASTSNVRESIKFYNAGDKRLER